MYKNKKKIKLVTGRIVQWWEQIVGLPQRATQENQTSLPSNQGNYQITEADARVLAWAEIRLSAIESIDWGALIFGGEIGTNHP